ncbi:hypothetical protein G1C95_1118 [Bifidobacterium sp. DSM 109957]|uniref:Uncharacterized protein n=1 Tax=Bifidobacterium oedipodis TaxID=2675322 RepID=A0A7Y0HSE4_9BIFI|nr:hypothetical protein [Bifidobacterium sp. DSM 109957]
MMEWQFRILYKVFCEHPSFRSALHHSDVELWERFNRGPRYLIRPSGEMFFSWH